MDEFDLELYDDIGEIFEDYDCPPHSPEMERIRTLAKLCGL